MKYILICIVLTNLLNAGFFKEEEGSKAAEMKENERLCKLFTHKAETYKKGMRDDVLAKATLASYEHRASLFCAKVKERDNNTSK